MEPVIDPATPVVLLHAFPLSSAMWSGEEEALAGRPVLAPDLPGFGERPPDPSDVELSLEPDLDQFAERVVSDMDEAGFERAVIVGLSMGGYVAFRLHALHADRVAGMVLADTRAGADDDDTRKKRTDQAERVRQEGVGWLADALLPALLGETTMRDRSTVVARVRAMISRAHPEAVARALLAMRERPDSTGQLGDIRVPVLVVVGEEDVITPIEDARKIAEGVPQGRLEVLPHAGHLSNLEDPEAFQRVLRSFLG
jgi:pimeloyl-ACP methyl ester carboxylesterase